MNLHQLVINVLILHYCCVIMSAINWPHISQPIQLIKMKHNRLSNRFCQINITSLNTILLVHHNKLFVIIIVLTIVRFIYCWCILLLY
jgi:hypothetical protein